MKLMKATHIMITLHVYSVKFSVPNLTVKNWNRTGDCSAAV